VAPRYDLPKTAPEPLRKLQLYVNSVDLEHDVEWLATPADLTALLGKLGLDPGGGAVRRELERARELREALRELMRATTLREAPAHEALAIVNGIAADGRLTVELDERGSPRFVARAPGVAGALAGLVGVLATARLDGGAERLKACRQCGWVFWDESRNRTATWCSMAICGNRLKTRRYRRRNATRRA
jgi:predicted RNA-binding Zn ribbon-like protein